MELSNLFLTALSFGTGVPLVTVRRGVTVEFVRVPKKWFGEGWELVNPQGAKIRIVTADQEADVGEGEG